MRPQNRWRRPAAGHLGVVQDRDPALVEAREVEVALVLVQRVARARRRAGERDLEPVLGQHLGGVEALPAAAPVGDQHRPGDRRRGSRSPSRRRRAPGRRRGRARTGRLRRPPPRPVRRVRPRAGGEDDHVGGGERRPRPPPRPAAARSRRARAAAAAFARQRRHSSPCAGARPASRSWPPMSPPRSTSVTASPCAAASTAAATPAGPAPTTTTASRRSRARPPRQRPLAAGARVDEAADRHAGVVVADAALVAADARRAPRPAGRRAPWRRGRGRRSARASCRPRRRRPTPTRRSAAARSTTRVVPITGTRPTAARIGASGPAIAASGVGGGGAIQLDAAT